MKYALFVPEIDQDPEKASLALWNFANSVSEVLAQKGQVQMLNTGAYLCSIQHRLNALSPLVLKSEERGLRYRILFFEDDPSWVIS